jgi:dipeptidyl aminopeptidase/acylaminoacyl peptidase
LAFSFGPALAQTAVRDHDIEPEDYFDIGTIMACELSPDGDHIAYTEMRWGEDKERRTTDLWVVDGSTQVRERLTFERVGAASPTWSPDGAYIYFRGRFTRPGDDKPPYNGKAQVWRVSPEGGDAFPITKAKDGIGMFSLSKDGRTLLYTKSTEHVDDEWKDLQKKYSDLEYGHGVTDLSQVWSLDLESWWEKKLVDEKRVIQDMALSPDGKRLAMLTTPDDTLLSNEGWSRLDVYDMESGKIAKLTSSEWRKDHPSPYGWLQGLAWSADSEALAFSVGFDGYPDKLYVAEWDDKDAAVRRLNMPEGVTRGGGRMLWRGDSRELCFFGEHRARVRIYGIEDVEEGGQGESRILTPGDVVVTAVSFDPSGKTLAVVMSTTQHMRDLFLVSKRGAFERITNVNPQVDTWKLPQISLVTWTGANGDEVEGILELPPDYEPGDGPLPMVVELHGGPTAATQYRIRFWIYGRTLLAAKGYALLSPNYRGSTGYGDKFLTDLIGRENDIEIQDILTGVDAMVQRGIADPDKLGVMGWSNGGLLTDCIITHTDRFKAASTGAGIIDMVLQWGTEDTPGHVINYMQGLPWEVPDAYRKASAVFKLDKVRTPTLIHVGGADHRCPPGHSRALYRALRHYLDIPTQLVVYPGEGHGLTTRENRLAKMEWDLAWFDKYLLGKTDEAEEEKDEEKPED